MKGNKQACETAVMMYPTVLLGDAAAWTTSSRPSGSFTLIAPVTETGVTEIV